MFSASSFHHCLICPDELTKISYCVFGGMVPLLFVLSESNISPVFEFAFYIEKLSVYSLTYAVFLQS